MYRIHAFTRAQKQTDIKSGPEHFTFRAEWFASAKTTRSVPDWHGVLWTERLSNMKSDPKRYESGIVWTGPWIGLERPSVHTLPSIFTFFTTPLFISLPSSHLCLMIREEAVFLKSILTMREDKMTEVGAIPMASKSSCMFKVGSFQQLIWPGDDRYRASSKASISLRSGARNTFHPGIWKSVFIKTMDPMLCRQKGCVFHLGSHSNNVFFVLLDSGWWLVVLRYTNHSHPFWYTTGYISLISFPFSFVRLIWANVFTLTIRLCICPFILDF